MTLWQRQSVPTNGRIRSDGVRYSRPDALQPVRHDRAFWGRVGTMETITGAEVINGVGLALTIREVYSVSGVAPGTLVITPGPSIDQSLEQTGGCAEGDPRTYPA